MPNYMRRTVLSVVVLVLLGTTFLLLIKNAASIKASSNYSMTARPVSQQATWRNKGSRRVPVRLKQTIRQSASGGGAQTSLLFPKSECKQIASTETTEFWIISSALAGFWGSSVVWDVPALPYAEYCGQAYDTATTARVIDARGASVPMRLNSDHSDHADRVLLEPVIDFPPDQVPLKPVIEFPHLPPDTYTVEIISPQGKSLRHSLKTTYPNYLGSAYNGPGFNLSREGSQEITLDFSPGDTIQIDYANYTAGEQIEVGLYQLQRDEVSTFYVLQTSWVVTATGKESQRGFLPIPHDAENGAYAIVAVTLNPTQLQIDNLLDPLGMDSILGTTIGDNYYYHVQFDVRTPVVSSSDETCTYKAKLTYETPLDSARIPADTDFDKIWRLRNDGTCVWGPSQDLSSLAQITGTTMTSTAKFMLPHDVLPGEEVDIKIPMTAPSNPGKYRSEWKLLTVRGTMVGTGAKDLPLWVEIVVP